MSQPTRKKLIEVALPLEAINTASAREKSIRHGHPSTLHLWWARRPLAAARAVIFAQMVDDPSGYVDTLRSDGILRRQAESLLKGRHQRWVEATSLLEKAKKAGINAPEPGPEPKLDDILAEVERNRLFKIIEDLVQWENTTNEEVLNRARAEIWQSWRRTCAENAGHPRAKELFDRHKLPAFHDPFAGGGALPLEAQRLGLESYASDLNPVAVLINKAMIEIPPKFAGRPPINPEARANHLGTRASRPHRGWNSRGYLPHFDHSGLVQSITFRLADSVPADVVDEWRVELKLIGGESAGDPRCAELRKRIEKYSDEGKGACWLRNPEVAEIVENALLHFDGERYRLLAWCVMPNHVHALIETMDGFPLGDVVHSWKSFTAKECNRVLKRRGEFWMPDYFDRFIREAKHFRAVVDYIGNNPVKAGLCEKPEEWRWNHLGTRASRPHRLEEKAGGTPAFPGFWRGAQGLAEDVRYYGQWMRAEAEKRIGHLYPKVEVTLEMAKNRPDLKPYVGRKLTVIAWLWARTVKSPNPAFAKVDVPLASTFMLSTKAGKEAYVEPAILRTPGSGTPGSAGILPAEGAGGTPAVPAYRFTVKVGKPKDAGALKCGTRGGRAQDFLCLLSGVTIPRAYVRDEGKARRLGSTLMATVVEGDRGRLYLSPTDIDEQAARSTAALAVVDEARKTFLAIPTPTRAMITGGVCSAYGLATYGDLFTPRQLVALTTFSDLVQEARERAHRDALAAGLPADAKPLRDGGTGATAYAEAVGVYLAFAISKLADRGSTICTWFTERDSTRNTFARQSIPMTWDYAELNTLLGGTGSFVGAVTWTAESIEGVAAGYGSSFGAGEQLDATSQSVSNGKVVSTDPPYYDNIGYADLSDFFYVWLRRSLRPVFPELFATLAVPKAEELVATPYRHGSKEAAETFFLDGMTRAMRRLAEQAHPAFPVTIYYAFKQTETPGSAAVPSASENGGQDARAPRLIAPRSTGWETFLDAVIRAGFAISGTWPMRTELSNRMIGSGTNALASSIILVCRPRAANAPTATRREFISTLKAELPVALRHLQEGNIAPVDLAQAAIGPGMAVFTRYARVLDADGKPLTVREALALINQTLDEALAEQEGDFDADSRWAITWFEQSGFTEGEYGVAETLSKAKNTSVQGLEEAGILKQGRGKVRILRPDELPADWDPAADDRLTNWETVHHLIRVLGSGGESAASQLVAKLGSKAEPARELCYRLYTLCERKKRAAEALSYNALVQSWPEISRLAQQAAQANGPEQVELI